MKGFGCDDKVIVKELATITYAQREEVIKKYKTMYGKSFVNVRLQPSAHLWMSFGVSKTKASTVPCSSFFFFYVCVCSS